mgnify:CR=1 FL=1
MKLLEKLGTPNVVSDIISNINIKKSIQSGNLLLNINEDDLKCELTINFISGNRYNGDINYKDCLLSNFNDCIIMIS